jgi:hypothetical protein
MGTFTSLANVLPYLISTMVGIARKYFSVVEKLLSDEQLLPLSIASRPKEIIVGKKLTESALREELKELKDWYSIYQWHGTSGIGYTEWVSGWLAERVDEISTLPHGLREQGFRQNSHNGQARLKAGTEHRLTEDRIFRAVFNLGEMPLMGRVLDYQVPLKKSQDAKHGKVDLLCGTTDRLFCVEAKRPESRESILKAVLEAFVYTSLVANRRATFALEYELPGHLLLTPAVLIFEGAPAFQRQLKCGHQNSKLSRLISFLNRSLERQNIAALRFFVIRNNISELEAQLRNIPNDNGESKPSFTAGFTLDTVEWRAGTGILEQP